jgi:hypothetical protein
MRQQRREIPPRSAFHAGADFFRESQPKGLANVQDVLGGGQIGGASMCDYSLHAVGTRPAEVAEVQPNFLQGRGALRALPIT